MAKKKPRIMFLQWPLWCHHQHDFLQQREASKLLLDSDNRQTSFQNIRRVCIEMKWETFAKKGNVCIMLYNSLPNPLKYSQGFQNTNTIKTIEIHPNRHLQQEHHQIITTALHHFPINEITGRVTNMTANNSSKLLPEHLAFWWTRLAPN